MDSFRQRGFTIVEVMLFLAITGLLIATLLGGWTVMINTQRYKDSVDTVYGFMQDQYNLVYNVENGRTNSLSCDDNGEISEGDTTAPERGQSNCVLMGRYVRLSGGTQLESYAVVGTEPTEAEQEDVDGTDAAVIRLYEPTVVTQSIGLTEVALEVPWQAEIKGIGSQSEILQELAFIIVRSPISGTVHTYIVNAAGAVDPVLNLADIDSDNEDARTLCIDPGAVIQGERQAVVMRAFASSQNSVETLGSNNGC